MLKIAICDDEKEQRLLLKKNIEIVLQLEGISYEIKEFDSGEKLIPTLLQTKYDIIFLDIEMKLLDGMQTAKEIRNYDKKAILIFVTAYADFVFQGYEVQAFQYILKPYRAEKIDAVMKAALEEWGQLQDIYFSIESKSGIQKINIREILYFYSDKRIIYAVTKQKEYSFYDRLDEVERRLPEFFVRIHQRYLINVNLMTQVERERAFFGEAELPVSRKYQDKLMICFAKTMI